MFAREGVHTLKVSAKGVHQYKKPNTDKKDNTATCAVLRIHVTHIVSLGEPMHSYTSGSGRQPRSNSSWSHHGHRACRREISERGSRDRGDASC